MFDKYVEFGVKDSNNRIHLVSWGQEYCTALGYCNLEYDSFSLKGHFAFIQITVYERKWPAQ
jgi:hypothetical protein